ncbi:hypothetical protein [Glycocaulis sp.]
MCVRPTMDADRIETYRRLLSEVTTFLEEAADLSDALQVGAPGSPVHLIARIDQAGALARAAKALLASESSTNDEESAC